MLKALGSGLAGAVVLNAVHESARQIIPHAPRVDVIGRRAIAKPIRAMGKQPPRGKNLYLLTLAGDVASNAVYYSIVRAGVKHHTFRRGLALGLIGGLGAVFLPRLIGLGRQPGQRTPWTQIMTVAWYTLGGVAAAVASEAMEQERK